MDECWPTVASPASVRLDDVPVIGTECPKMHNRFCNMPTFQTLCRTQSFNHIQMRNTKRYFLLGDVFEFLIRKLFCERLENVTWMIEESIFETFSHLGYVSLYLFQTEKEKTFDVYSQLINYDGIKCNHIKLLCNQSGIFSLNCSSL